MRAPHLAHAAAAQQLDKAITPERRALHRLTIRSSTEGQTSYCGYYFRRQSMSNPPCTVRGVSERTSSHDEEAAGPGHGQWGVAYCPPVPAAHSPNARDRWHSLADHLAQTGQRAAAFGEAFGSADACRFVGELHDIGKADPSWQRYLAVAATGTKLATVDHKHAGAFVSTD